jgi:hypothetical protein
MDEDWGDQIHCDMWNDFMDHRDERYEANE